MALSQTHEPLCYLKQTQTLFLLLRSYAGCVSLFLLFSSLQHVDAGDVVALFCMSPVLTHIFMHAVLSKPVSHSNLISIASSVNGAWVYSLPFYSVASHTIFDHPTETDNYGRVLAVLNATCALCVYIIIRKVGAVVNFMISVLALAFCYLCVGVALGGRSFSAEPTALNGLTLCCWSC